MYHYVRKIRFSDFPRINGREISDFESQIKYLMKNYNIISASALVESIKSGEKYKEPAILTFDDGYKDHFEVYKILKKYDLSGVFFPPAAPILEHKVLDVNKIHHILANCKSELGLVSEIESMVISLSEKYNLEEISTYRTRYWKSSRLDTGAVIYIKRMLQKGLPESARALITDSLFKKYVTCDEESFAHELYLSLVDLKEMHENGMEIGGHGYTHSWLNSLSPSEQLNEIDATIGFLKNIGVSDSNFIFCYPYGAYNTHTLDILKSRGCLAAFTTNPTTTDYQNIRLMEIPRLDTIDLPI